MKLRPFISILSAASLALMAISTNARATPSNLTALADSGVVAVAEPMGIRTGFAFGDSKFVIVGGARTAKTHLITAHGLSATGIGTNQDGGLAALYVSTLHLLALRASDAREIHSETAVYVLGAPLGYNGERIRPVRLPEIALASTRAVVIGGRLPRSFLGAPVVTRSGRLVGAVASIGTTNWTFATRSRLEMLLTTSVKPGAGNRNSAIAVTVVLFVAILATCALVSVRMGRKRRDRENKPVVVRHTQSPPRRSTEAPLEEPTLHATQPLVRRRETEAIQDEDFIIILKSREDQ
jgi:hypothetical protein